MKNKYVKSPLQYTGGKYKLLPQIIPLMPKEIDLFIDLFGGGFNVGINISAKKIYYNDVCYQVGYLLETLYNESLEDSLSRIDELIDTYKLSKENREGFLLLREKFNKEVQAGLHDMYKFYVLICYAFNNQIRFNKNGEYNMPFGKDRSSFNDTLRAKFIEFVNELHKKDILFTQNDFRRLKANNIKSGTYVYCDPPYLNTTATYNENNGWTENDERDLRKMLILLNSRGIKFGLSNNTTYNTNLTDWAERNGFTVHHINANYSNCNYHKKEKVADDEVFITNYKVGDNT